MKQASLVLRMFCAQIQSLEVDSIIAIEREGAIFFSQIISLQARALRTREVSPGGHLQTVTVMSEAECGSLGKHFRLRAGGWPKDRPSAFPGLCTGQPILTETTRKRSPGTWAWELDPVVILELLFNPITALGELRLFVVSAQGAFVEWMDG